MPKVLALFPGKMRELGGCEIYRITMPFAHLQTEYSEWTTGWAFYEDLWTKAQIEGREVWKDLISEYDLFVFPRMYFKREEDYNVFKFIVTGLHHLGKKVIYEVDDDMTNDDRYVVDGDAIRAAAMCDAISVTTPYLAELMQRKTGKKTYVLPNMVSPEVWYAKTTGQFLLKDKLVLGLTGSATHREDWKVLEHVLPKVMQDSNLHLLIMGFHPAYLDGLPNTTYLQGLPYTKYSQIIQSCDIILAPLNNDPFNLSKSPIKCIEGMAARRKVGNFIGGAACIASDHSVYQLALKNNQTGLLVKHNPDNWQEGLDRLIYNQALRESIQIEGHQWVQKHHDISKRSVLWSNAYKAVLKKVI